MWMYVCCIWINQSVSHVCSTNNEPSCVAEWHRKIIVICSPKKYGKGSFVPNYTFRICCKNSANTISIADEATRWQDSEKIGSRTSYKVGWEKETCTLWWSLELAFLYTHHAEKVTIIIAHKRFREGYRPSL